MQALRSFQARAAATAVAVVAALSSSCAPSRGPGPFVPAGLSPQQHEAPFKPITPTLPSEALQTLPRTERQVGKGKDLCEFGTMRFENPEISYSKTSQTIHLRAKAAIQGSIHELDLFGKVGEDGTAALLPVKGDPTKDGAGPKFRARAVCMAVENNAFVCTSLFVDVYARMDGTCLTEQFLLETAEAPAISTGDETPKAPAAPPADDLEPITENDTEEFSGDGPEHGEPLPEREGRFVGFQKQVDDLFSLETPVEWVSPTPIQTHETTADASTNDADADADSDADADAASPSKEASPSTAARSDADYTVPASMIAMLKGFPSKATTQPPTTGQTPAAPAKNKQEEPGLLKRIWDKIVGEGKTNSTPEKPSPAQVSERRQKNTQQPSASPIVKPSPTPKPTTVDQSPPRPANANARPNIPHPGRKPKPAPQDKPPQGVDASPGKSWDTHTRATTPLVVPEPENRRTPTPPDKPSPPAAVNPAARNLPQAIGCYGSGIMDPQRPNVPCNGGQLMNAAALDLQAEHFQVMRPARKGHFATDLMVSFIDRLAKLIMTIMPGHRLQIGDVSRERGGKFGTHSSHQNGLDADLGFLVKSPSPASFVTILSPKGGLDPAKVFVDEQWLTFKRVVSTNLVSRIFVNGAIKKGFCAHAKRLGELEAEKETLRRIRQATGHVSHWHLRLKCPQNESGARCRDEIPPANVNGC